MGNGSEWVSYIHHDGIEKNTRALMGESELRIISGQTSQSGPYSFNLKAIVNFAHVQRLRGGNNTKRG
jgi:hypothetical protein